MAKVVIRAAATVGEWLRTVQPPSPPALARRMAELVGDDAGLGVDQVAQVLLGAGERGLAELLVAHATTRDSALDLLAVDALVTYAFQASADDPEQLDERAFAAMMRIGALAAGAAE